jgi:hypothetical protein
MNNRTKFLQNNVGFHFEDLSLIRQMELEATQKQMGVSADWIMLALSKDSLESWEKWGFNLFKKPDFKAGVDALLDSLNKLDDSKFDREVKKKSKGDRLTVSEETFRKVFNAVKEQGGILLPDEAEQKGYVEYYTLGYAVKPDSAFQKVCQVAEWIKQDDIADEDERVEFFLSVQRVSNVVINRQGSRRQ